MNRTGNYDESSIDILEGIEAVRKRPGMYIGGTGEDGLHHLLWEIVDNAVDEAMNGYGNRIQVTLQKDGTTCTVEDNGRGIPVGIHPKYQKSTLELIFTTLHSGAKFSDSSYITSGGLHGVGSSAVNALSSKFEATVRRDGFEWVQTYRRGKPRGPVEKVGPARGTGTKITFTPDTRIFEDTGFNAERVHKQLQVKAFLNKGLKVIFRDKVNDVTHTMHHEGGLVDYLDQVVEVRGLKAVLENPFVLDRENGITVNLALTWTDGNRERMMSYVNGIPTKDGGTHVQGFRDGLAKALRSFIETHDLVPRGLSLTADDLREGVLCILSVLHPDPQFQGQTKDRLNNPDVRGILDGAVRQAFEKWLHENQSQGKTVVARAIQAARARIASRQAANAVRRKASTTSRLNLPGKLADCSSKDPDESELFIVEGDSAGGSAKQGRDRKTQAILPLRGKVLNAEQATLKRILANEELNNVVTALGCGLGRDLKLEHLRYGKIILLMDADSDGHHISTLLLTFLFRHMRPLIENGFVYIAQPPLYRINAGKETFWALDDRDRSKILKRLPPRTKPEITRFKGLGEMPPKTLFSTTLDPKRRRLLQVTLSDPIEADRTVANLMGKDPAPRFHFIMREAKDVQDLDV